jgi:hypothetical protein
MAINIGDSIGGGAQVGSVLFVGAGPVLAQDQSNLFWDNTNKRLGIGTTTPNNGLTVRKSIGSGAVRVDSINTSTGSGANAEVTVSVAGASAGDAVMIYEVSGVMSWIVGLDNSEADVFKIAFSNLSTVHTRLAVTTDGKVGVSVDAPSARLHLPAGSASAASAALKLTAGTLLSTPEVGAIEFEGSQLYITQVGGTRRSLIPPVADVLDFGAIGDGSTVDSAAFQAAIDSIEATGGLVLVPPNRTYVVGDVTIRSQYPVTIKSAMGQALAIGGASTMVDKCRIRPPADGCQFIFKWERDTAIQPTEGLVSGARSKASLLVISILVATSRRSGRSRLPPSGWKMWSIS